MSRIAAVVGSVALWLVPAHVAADVPIPAVTGPITGPGAVSLASTTFDLVPFGYVEEEFFLAGTASGYVSDGALGSDGRWSAVPGSTAAYTTRIVVRRPTTRRRFNGTVVVEWLNVSGGFDAANDWTFAHTLLLREGFAWVGVSAQYVGVSGGPPLFRNRHLKAVNPVRYAALVHPGDTYSYDIFSQSGLAVRRLADRLLGGLRPERLIAIGESQSAFRLVTYVNAVHPVARVFDGFLVHSRGGDAAPLSESPQPPIGTPIPARIRDDVEVPVLTFQTETDVVSVGFFAARQPDAPNIRTWEVAGTAHADTYLILVGPDDRGRAAADTTHLAPVQAILDGTVPCARPINAGPQHYVLNAALRRLARWVRSGRSPAPAPPLSVRPGSPPVIERDPLGNAVGGIRTPPVDAPIAALSGIGQGDGSPCGRFGTTIAFDAETLASLYPHHRSYVRAVDRAARRATRLGFLVSVDARAVRRAAASSAVRR
ncbi:MAG TPA: alpha/beta hydrolase domain-containing protein [Candidatus Binatia bacterium]|nr:alpha/beta hydrolase domain-containing protein [Candidatus Binatia bacterium]